MEHVGSNWRFLKHAFNTFFSTELIEFFQTKKVDITIERGGRAFPTSELAGDIFTALIRWG